MSKVIRWQLRASAAADSDAVVTKVGEKIKFRNDVSTKKSRAYIYSERVLRVAFVLCIVL